MREGLRTQAATTGKEKEEEEEEEGMVLEKRSQFGCFQEAHC
jgi:hypothetical protein